jgi:hypothetical protein
LLLSDKISFWRLLGVDYIKARLLAAVSQQNKNGKISCFLVFSFGGKYLKTPHSLALHTFALGIPRQIANTT